MANINNIKTGNVNIPGALHSTGGDGNGLVGGVVAYAGDIYDTTLLKNQSQINQEFSGSLSSLSSSRYITHSEGQGYALGNNTYADGDSSFAVGYSRAEGDYSHAEGDHTYAKGEASHAEGGGATAYGNLAHAEGYVTIASGVASHAEGYYTATLNDGEHASGKYNKSTLNVTLFSVGIGTDQQHRTNAFEVTTDGKMYIKDIGEYNGDELTGKTDLATIITNVNTRLAALEGVTITAEDVSYDSSETYSNGTVGLAIQTGITSAAASAAAAASSASTASGYYSDILTAMGSLGSGEAVAAQVAINQADIAGLKSNIVVDLSTRYSTSYANLSAALTALNNDTATDAATIRKGGVSIKFINSSTNKYEQWSLKASSWSTNTSDWALDVDGSNIPIDKIEVEGTQSEEQAIVFETDGGTQVGKIDANGADFANLKRGGQQVARMSDLPTVPTLDTSIGNSPSDSHTPSTKAVKDYVDNNILEVPEYPIETEAAQSEAEEVIFCNDTGTQQYAKVSSLGIRAVAFKDMQGNNIIPIKDTTIGETPSQTNVPTSSAVADYVSSHGIDVDGIEKEPTTSTDEAIVAEDSNGVELFRADKNGLSANESIYVSYDNKKIPVELGYHNIVLFDGIYTSNPLLLGNYTYSMYYNPSQNKFYKYINGNSVEVAAQENVLYRDKVGQLYQYKDRLYPVSPLYGYTYTGNLNMPDLTDIVEGFSPRNVRGIPSEIYGLFDGLIGTDSSVKIDVPALLNISYPDYANGLTSDDNRYVIDSGDTHDTPAYKIYAYKISRYTNTYNTGKKILLFSGEHGNEQASIYDLFIFAYNLINSTDEFYMHIRSNYDVYILPMLSVYSVYHSLRTNAVGVNINRNYPCNNWVESGSGTLDYTGETAGSEFETQVIMRYMQYLNPEITVDHHNYTRSSKQFYLSTHEYFQGLAVTKALIDCSRAFIKAYPEYFGSSPKLFTDAVSRYCGNAGVGQFATWANNEGFYGATLIETSDCICYNDGEPASTAIDKFGHSVFEVNEYTMRSTIGCLIEYISKTIHRF